MTQTKTATENVDLIAAILAQVEVENAEIVELPAPTSVTAFPSPFDGEWDRPRDGYGNYAD